MTSVSLSTDGLKICIGTESGALSVLDIVSPAHETVIRSHTDSINALSITKTPSHELQFLTGSLDGTLRQWRASNEPIKRAATSGERVRDVMEPYLEDKLLQDGSMSPEKEPLFVCSQSHEFHCRPDQILSMSEVSQDSKLAVGFNTGLIRIFCIDNSTIIKARLKTTSLIFICDQELYQQGARIVGVEFSRDGQKLFACDALGEVMVYDAETDYRPLKQLRVSQKDHFIHLALSTDSRIAINSPTEILLLNTSTLKPDFKITTGSRNYRQ